MRVRQLLIQHFRIIEQMQFAPCSGVNLITGGNGAGKTSVLEAIYLAGRGQSFRHREAGPFIREGERSARVVLKLTSSEGVESILGIERSARSFRLRHNGQDLKKRSELLRALPLQLITPQSHALLERGPELRRRFIDLGLFHVEHDCHALQSTYTRALKQRNAALRNSPRIAGSWDQQLTETADALHLMREAYIKTLTGQAKAFMSRLNEDLDFSISYKPGWDTGRPLSEQLKSRLSSDIRQGHTSVGPHRADLAISTRGGMADKRLSRGQQKLLVSALHLAQAEILKTRKGVGPLILVDDLPAELDRDHRARLAALLEDSGLQCFITAVDADQLSRGPDWAVFHVEHGRCQG